MPKSNKENSTQRELCDDGALPKWTMSGTGRASSMHVKPYMNGNGSRHASPCAGRKKPREKKSGTSRSKPRHMVPNTNKPNPD